MLKRLGQQLIHSGDAVSQWANVTVLWGRNPNESISNRCWRLRKQPYWRHLYRFVNWLFSPFSENHCMDAYRRDLERARQLLEANGWQVVPPGEVRKPVVSDPHQLDVDLNAVDKMQGLEKRIARSAAFYEQNWDEFKKDVLDDPEERGDWHGAVRSALWSEIVKAYPDELLYKIERDGTVFAFTKEIASMILRAILEEKTARQAGWATPTRNGMGPEGSARYD